MQQGDNSFDLTGGMSAVQVLCEQRGGVAQCLLPGDIVEKLESGGRRNSAPWRF